MSAATGRSARNPACTTRAARFRWRPRAWWFAAPVVALSGCTDATTAPRCEMVAPFTASAIEHLDAAAMRDVVDDALTHARALGGDSNALTQQLTGLGNAIDRAPASSCQLVQRARTALADLPPREEDAVTRDAVLLSLDLAESYVAVRSP